MTQFSPEFSKKLRMLSSNSDDHEISDALNYLVNKAKSSNTVSINKSEAAPIEDEPEPGDTGVDDEDDEEIERSALLTATSLRNLQRERDQLQSELAALQTYIDQAELNKVLQKVSESVIDLQSANEALVYYTADWFRGLPFSADGKQQIAAQLIEKVRPLVGRTHPLWRELSRGDLYALNTVKYSYQLDSEDEPDLDEIQELDQNETEAIESYDTERQSRDDWDERKEADEPKPGLRSG